MPSAADIYANIRQPAAAPDPLEQYGRMVSIKSLMGGEQLNEMQRTKLARDMQEEEQFRNLFQGATPEQMSAPEFLQRSLAASPTRGLALQKNMLEQQKTKAELGKIDVETRAANAKEARDALAGVSDQASYQGFLDLAKKSGWQIANGAPTAYSQDWTRQHLMTADKFIEQTTPKFEKIDVGGKIETVDTNPITNPSIKTMNFKKTLTPGEVQSGQHANAQLAETKRHNLAEEGSPEQIESAAQAIANLQQPPLEGRASSSPVGLKVMQRVNQLKPGYSAADYKPIESTLNAFAVGAEGKNVASISKTIDHAQTLRELGAALDNGNTPLFNKLAQEWAQRTGKAAPTNFEAAKNIIGGEIVKGIVGAGGGEGDREKAQGVLDKVSSPAQLSGALNTITDLLGGQLKGLEQQYKAGTNGRADFRTKYLTPAAQKAFESHGAPKGDEGKPQAERTIGTAKYVKINGQWYESR